MTAARIVPFTIALLPLLAAAEPAAVPSPPKTLMNAPGKLLLADDLTGPLGPAWKAAKGRWEAANGGVRGSELKADRHGAVARRAVAMTDVVVELTFRLDGAKQTSLSFNAEKGHVCRVLVRPTGVTVQKDDQDGRAGPDRGAPLATREVAVKPGVWHTLVVELRGPDILATLDGTHAAYGAHPAIDKPKANLGLTVAGESVSFKGLRVWDAAGPASGWEAAKAKLLSQEKK